MVADWLSRPQGCPIGRAYEIDPSITSSDTSCPIEKAVKESREEKKADDSDFLSRP